MNPSKRDSEQMTPVRIAIGLLSSLVLFVVVVLVVDVTRKDVIADRVRIATLDVSGMDRQKAGALDGKLDRHAPRNGVEVLETAVTAAAPTRMLRIGAARTTRSARAWMPATKCGASLRTRTSWMSPRVCAARSAERFVIVVCGLVGVAHGERAAGSRRGQAHAPPSSLCRPTAR
jgi:hypothetical protein